MPELLDRSEALRQVFRALDADNSGSIEMKELLVLATGLCPAMTEDDCRAVFKVLDADGDAKVDEEEYLQCMLTITADIPQQEFEHEIRDLLARSDKATDDPKYYFHCENNRAYLEAELLPMVEQGLNALMEAVEAERLRVAAGADWDEGYLPPDWRPLRPLQFLGEWLRANSVTGIKQKEEADAAAEAQRKKEFNEMNRHEKLRHSFQAMDRDGSGTLDFDEMLFVCRKINPGKGLEEAKSQVAWMDKDGDGQVDQEEYVKAMTDLMDDIDQETFDAGVNKVLTAVKFAYATREEKLKMVFDHIDADGSGELDKEELTMLAKALVPGGDETKVKKTLAWLDKDGDSNVSFDEFKEPMLSVTAKLDDDTFDAAIHKLLRAEGEAVEPDPAEDLPPKFGSYVSTFDSHATVSQIGMKKLNNLVSQKKKIAMVDCRPEEQQAVSVIPGSITLRGVEFKSAVEGENNIAECIEKADFAAAAGCDLVLAISSVGAESGMAAPLLAEKIGAPTHNLCGGIIAWYNAGGEVHDHEGNPVEAVHPGTKRCIGFVKPRKNTFKFGKKK